MSKTQRWIISHLTFDGYVADFATNNVGVKNGYLLLGFSTSDNSNLIEDVPIPVDPLNSVNEIEAGNSIFPNPCS